MNEPKHPCAIAIPARNEAALIGRCLTALAAQTAHPASLAVIVVANNCTDATAAIARASHWPMQMTVIEEHFSAGQAHAGSARRLAVQVAALQSDIILTTDADCVADSDWAASMMTAFSRSVDAVAGRVSGDWDELRHQSETALKIGGLEWEYLSLLGEAEALFDPRDHDPAPRHAQRCGANIGITRMMLEQVGGVPAVPTGEDRALLHAVERIDGRLRHDPHSHVTASARITGRAAGGMADALAARLSADYLCDDQFERAETLVARLRARHAARQRWSRRDGATFGQEWSAHLPSQPRLQPQRITPAELPHEIAILRHLIANARDG
jgi:cellulose synthase/poly-beta-1,6-N-acetylglucosamine synthase-like glycosyltransferase